MKDMLNWTTANGEVYPLHRIRDDHLVNVAAHLCHYFPHSQEFLIVLKECLRRNISIEEISGGPYPYFDQVEKVWKQWDFMLRRDVEISAEKAVFGRLKRELGIWDGSRR